jgi:hypothetical protein
MDVVIVQAREDASSHPVDRRFRRTGDAWRDCRDPAGSNSDVDVGHSGALSNAAYEQVQLGHSAVVYTVRA